MIGSDTRSGGQKPQNFAGFFGGDSPLANVLHNYSPRPEQQIMAERVAQAIAESNVLVIEAGTGIGKTLAYLVPVLMSGRRVIISTGTRALQDQLFNKDLPAVSRAIGRPVDIALLKGRQNYLCRHRLHLVASGELTNRAVTAADVAGASRWGALTATGDIAEVDYIPENSPVWTLVTSTIDNCLGVHCPDYDSCHLVDARRRAQAADVVVVNHHLLLADLALKEDGFGEVLPGADAIIVDEAHQLADIATQFFGLHVGSRRLFNLARDTTAECINAGLDRQLVESHVHRFEQVVRETQLLFAGNTDETNAISWSTTVVEALEQIQMQTDALAARLNEIADASAGLSRCADWAVTVADHLGLLLDESGEVGIRWIDRGERSFSARFAPYDVAEKLNRVIYKQCRTWVFTSATLAVGNAFDHFTERTGLDEPETCLLQSPFDYARNAMLYLPRGLPQPNTTGYTRAVLDATLPVLRATGGRAFLLFTSHRALREAADDLGRSRGGLPYPILVQGEAPRDKLLDRFRALGNGVLLGTGTFWEGVDVRGSALTVVMIDKLPFASPDDPLLKVRLEHVQRQGGNPFVRHQLPQAVIALKQGVGRLIRDFDDWGVAMICDPRLVTRSYGRVFLDSLPPMQQTDRFDDVERFIRERYKEPPVTVGEQ